MKIFASGKNSFPRRGRGAFAQHPHTPVSGNIFFALFAAVAMVGAVGYGFNSVIKGPISGMTEVTKRTVAESTVITTSRLAIIGATTKQDEGGDCDNDGMVEPLPFRTGTGSFPAGGGFLPTGIMDSTLDPWNTEYGYCAWDSGSKSMSDAVPGCTIPPPTGAVPNRLQGSPTGKQYALAIISAGKDRKFQTSCTAYNGGTPNASLITRTPGSDDIVLGYSYLEANDLGNGLWRPKQSDPTVAMSSKGMEVTGSGTFSGKVELQGNIATGGGLILPWDPGDNSITGPCNLANDKQMRRNTSSVPPTLEICDSSGGLTEWSPVSGAGGGGGGGGGGGPGASAHLVAQWKFDDATGSTTAVDSIGGHNGTLQSTAGTAPTLPAFFPSSGVDGNGAVSFRTGGAMRINVPRAAELEPSALTISYWVKRDATQLDYANIINKNWQSGSAPVYNSYFVGASTDADDGIFSFFNGYTGGQATNYYARSIPTNTWTHVTATYDPAGAAPQMKLYIDGFLDKSVTDTRPILYDATATGNLMIGGNPAGTNTFSGLIDDLRIYNSALTEAEVLEIYQSMPRQEIAINANTRPGRGVSWGYDPLGNGSLYGNTVSPTSMPGAVDMLQIVSNAFGGCGVKAGGSVLCWGVEANGEAGNGGVDATYDVMTPADITGVAKLAAGANHFCALKKNGEVWCWGKGTSGQLGNNASSSSNIPVKVSGSYKEIAGSFDSTCAIDYEGKLWCWGEQSQGALGNADGNNDKNYPYPVNTAYSDWVQMDGSTTSTYAAHFCAVRRTGQGYCWGTENHDEFANGPASGRQNAPYLTWTNTGSRWQKLSTEGNNTCGIAQGAVYCMGNNTYTQLGIAGNNAGGVNAQLSYPVHGDPYYVDVEVGVDFVCATRANGEMWCWGRDAQNQLGNGPAGTGSEWVPVKILDNVVSMGMGYRAGYAIMDTKTSPVTALPTGNIATGGSSVCALANDKRLWCWGTDANGGLANGAGVTSSSVPMPSSDTSTWTKIAMGVESGCGIKTTGALWCWGNNSLGQLGNGNTGTDQHAPVQITSTLPWAQISGGGMHNCGIKSDGSLWCWGFNADGQLGRGNTTTSNVPVAIFAGTVWRDISAGSSHTCGIQQNGDAYCWGANSDGRVGNGTTTTPITTPSRVDEPGPWLKISAGSNTSCGIKVDGSLWCWGPETSGYLGNNGSNAANIFSSPTLVYESGPWVSVSAGSLVNCGIKTDGSGWCWGTAAFGGSGATTGNSLVPVAIAGGGAWKEIDANYGCGIKTDDTIWCWGSDISGQLGNGPILTAIGYTPTKPNILQLQDPWTTNSTGAGVVAMSGISPIIGTTRFITPGAASTGLNLQGSGRSQLTFPAAPTNLILEANGSEQSSQVSFSARSAKVASDVNTGLVSKWLFDSLSGATAFDGIGGFNATLTNSPTWAPTAGKTGGALYFTRASNQNGRVTRNAALEPAAITIATWIKRAANDTGEQVILSKAYGGISPWSSYTLETADAAVPACSLYRVCFWLNGANGTPLPSTSTLPLHQWVYITATYDPAAPPPQMKIYINGVLENSRTYTSAIAYNNTATADVFIGNDYFGTGNGFTGYLDDTRIYNRALDASEVSQIFYYTSQDFVTRTMGLDYLTNNFKFSRNNNAADAWVNTLIGDIEVTVNGDVGIGTTGSPQAKLDVNGAVKVGSGGTCDGTKAGTLEWDGTNIRYCNGTGWTILSAASAAAITYWDAAAGATDEGEYFICSTATNGRSYCTGNNTYDNLGINETVGSLAIAYDMREIHSDISSTGWSDWARISTGATGACGLRANGTTWCWGTDFGLVLGNGPTSTNQLRPSQVHTNTGPGGWSDWISIEMNQSTACGVRANGTAWCWGTNHVGQLGIGTQVDKERPTRVQTDTGPSGWSDWISVSTGIYHSCGVRANGTAWCWGYPAKGPIGDGNTVTNRLRPVQVQTDTGPGGWSDWIMVSAARYSTDGFTCGLRNGGTLWCWGDNTEGQLGNGTTVQATRPVRVKDNVGGAGWSDWTYVRAGMNSTCGLRVDGTAWCWGNNSGGKIGDNTTTARSLPTQVQTDTGPGGWSDWVTIGPTQHATCGVRVDGTRWCWGAKDRSGIGWAGGIGFPAAGSYNARPVKTP